MPPATKPAVAPSDSLSSIGAQIQSPVKSHTVPDITQITAGSAGRTSDPKPPSWSDKKNPPIEPVKQQRFEEELKASNARIQELTSQLTEQAQQLRQCQEELAKAKSDNQDLKQDLKQAEALANKDYEDLKQEFSAFKAEQKKLHESERFSMQTQKSENEKIVRRLANDITNEQAKSNDAVTALIDTDFSYAKLSNKLLTGDTFQQFDVKEIGQTINRNNEVIEKLAKKDDALHKAQYEVVKNLGGKVQSKVESSKDCTYSITKRSK